MDETQTWKDIVYHLFIEGELNQCRCLAIMHNNNADTSEIVSAVIQGAVNRGQTEDIGTLSVNVTEFVRKMDEYERNLASEEKSRERIIQKFRSQLTMFIPMTTGWEKMLTTKYNPRIAKSIYDIKDNLPESKKPYFEAVMKERIAPKKTETIAVTKDKKCRICKMKFFGFEGSPGLEVCVGCVEEYVDALGKSPMEERLNYESDMRDFMEFLTNDKFAAEGHKKRKRAT